MYTQYTNEKKMIKNIINKKKRITVSILGIFSYYNEMNKRVANYTYK